MRAAERISRLSAAWNLVTSSLAIVLGITGPSLVLVAFGLTGLLDTAGSAALVIHFRHARRHEDASSRREQIAHRIICAGLFVTGAATAAESVRRLATHHGGEASSLGSALAGASVVVLGALAVRKRAIAALVGSAALRADSWLSFSGAALGGVTLVAAALGRTWWIDPTGALVIGLSACAIGVSFARQPAI